MSARPIIRDPGILDGRWHIAGTLIGVADLRRDFEDSGRHVRPVYRAMGLSDQEIDASLRFVFPTIRPVRLAIGFVDATVYCECGEHTRLITSDPELDQVHCICGRNWQLPTEIPANGETDASQNREYYQNDTLLGHWGEEEAQTNQTQEASGVSLAATIIVRAQQAVNRWMQCQNPEPFSESMRSNSRELWDSRPATDREQDAFCQVAQAIRIGRGHAFENHRPLLKIAQFALRDGT